MTIANSFDTLTLQAFALAIVRLDAAYLQPLKPQIQQIGELATHQPQEAAKQIRQLVEYHPELNQQYSQEYKRLTQPYQQQERAKSFAQSSSQSATAPITSWEQFTLAILTATDPIATARSLVKQTKSSPLPSKSQVFLNSLQSAVSATEAQAIAILKALEQRPLTITDLAHFVGMSVEHTHAIVQDLWNRGYLDRTNTHLLHNLFPILGQHRRQQESLHQTETYLTLTSKGHFFLHPVITLGNRRGLVE